MKVAVLFGGKSTEHNVSIVSGTAVVEHLNKEKYEVYPIYISKEDKYFKYTKDINDIKMLKIDEEINELEKIDNIYEYLKQMDVLFPVLHGMYGEDGTIQGLFELTSIPYVGCGVLASSICMDKVYTKAILNKANIIQSKSMYIKKYKDKYIYTDDNFDRYILSIDELIDEVDNILKFPVFIKPSRSGSSVGVHKSEKDEFINCLNDAFKYDNKILIEEAIIGREVECAILGNEDLEASNIGEIISADKSFYSYDSKYKNNESITVIPADIDKTLEEEIQNIAKKAYLACDCKGLSRVDFFIEDNTNKIILNEINTLPGFTSISMYPKLMQHYGYTYSQILDKLIELSLNKE